MWISWAGCWVTAESSHMFPPQSTGLLLNQCCVVGERKKTKNKTSWHWQPMTLFFPSLLFQLALEKRITTMTLMRVWHASRYSLRECRCATRLSFRWVSFWCLLPSFAPELTGREISAVTCKQTAAHYTKWQKRKEKWCFFTVQWFAAWVSLTLEELLRQLLIRRWAK